MDPFAHDQRSASSEPLLKPDDVARRLAVKPSWVYAAAREQRLPHIRIGRHIRFTNSRQTSDRRTRRGGLIVDEDDRLTLVEPA